MDDTFTDMADPCVLEFENHIYVYPTASQSDFSVWSAALPEDRDASFSPSDLTFSKSPEPVLTPSGGCLITTIVPALGKGTLTWAPHVTYDEKSAKFYMYFSKCLNLYVASSSSPTGPFGDEKFLQYLAIDPMLFHDDDTGKDYLYYADINLPRMWFGEESIYVQSMAAPDTFSDEPAVKLLKPSQHWWEYFRSSAIAPRGINEGPWLFKKSEAVYLMYSGAGADTFHYNLGYATCDTPMGPCEKSEQNPISVPQKPQEAGVFGPGHHAVWTDGETGKLWVFYHQKDSQDNGVWDRRICVDEMRFEEGGELLVPVTRG